MGVDTGNLDLLGKGRSGGKTGEQHGQQQDDKQGKTIVFHEASFEQHGIQKNGYLEQRIKRSNRAPSVPRKSGTCRPHLHWKHLREHRSPW